MILLPPMLAAAAPSAAAAAQTLPALEQVAPSPVAVSFTLVLVIMFAALFTTLAPRGPFSSSVALTTVLGVFCGSIAWWCFLVTAVSLARHAIGHKLRVIIDRIAGLALAVFGIVEVKRAI